MFLSLKIQIFKIFVYYIVKYRVVIIISNFYLGFVLKKYKVSKINYSTELKNKCSRKFMLTVSEFIVTDLIYF